MKKPTQIALLLVVLALLMIGCQPQTVVEVVQVEVTAECETQEPEVEAIHGGDQRILAVYDDWVGFYDSSGSPIETVSTDARVEVFTSIPDHIIMKDAADVCVFDMDGSQLDCFDIDERTEITLVDQRILAVYDDWVGFYDSSGSPIETVSTDARVEIFTSIPNHIIMKDAADVCVFDMDGSQLDCFDIDEGAAIIPIP